MLLFKTSGNTFESVIKNEKHAFFRIPKNWYEKEIILISKNKKDCKNGEKQIQYVTYLDSLRPTTHQEIEMYWPGNFGRWKYIAECINTQQLILPFNLEEVLEGDLRVYKNITPAMKIHERHENILKEYLLNNQ